MTTAMMLSQKRKRDKAQEQLRSRMRQRREGNGTSSTILQARRRHTIRDGKGGTLSGGMMNQSSSITVTPGDLLGSNYMHWQTQADQLNASGGVVPDRTLSNVKGADPIPMHELIKRVLQRKVDNAELGSSTLPIRNFKSRHVPYAVRHSSHVKKIVGTMTKHKPKGNTNRPAMVVVDKEESDDGRRRSRSHARLKAPLKPLRTVDSVPAVQGDLQATATSKASSQAEPQPYRLPTDPTRPDPFGQPQADDDAGSSHRLYTAREKEMTGTKMTLQHRDTSKPATNKKTILKSKPLPAINSANSSKLNKNLTSRLIEDAVIKSKSRCSSGDDILNLKTAQSEAMQKLEDMGEPTLLGTPRRFTQKMVRFKSDLGKVDKLSAIEEDRGISQVSKLSNLKDTPSISNSVSAGSKPLKGVMTNNSSVPNKTVDVGG